mmetsp:Transcript_85983/g.248205  ORF Transcript_85983/g.248205 Transcript_85983/m.248205 type:complete len:213 (-) Transcript_85983:1240-1878(-)
MASCRDRDSSRARSRIFARVSAFSASSRCFSCFFSSCLSFLSSSSRACCAWAICNLSFNSAWDISSKRPWHGASAGSNCLKRSTGTFSKARICRMRSRRRSISCSSSRRFRSASASFSLRRASAFSARARISRSSASRAFSRSSCVPLTICCFCSSSFSSSKAFTCISKACSSRCIPAMIPFFRTWLSKASIAPSRANCISTMRWCTRRSSS